MAQPNRSSRRGWLIFAGLLVALTLVATVLNARSDEGLLPYNKGELRVYTLAADRMLAGEEIYRPEDEKPFTYPPAMAVPFMPLASLPQYAHRPVWYATNTALLAFVLLLLHRLLKLCAPLRQGRGPALWVFWALTIGLSARHVHAVFENQSNDLLVFGFVMAGVYASCVHREKSSGVAAGFGAACKATPLLFLPMFLWQRRYAAALFVGLGAVAVVLLVDLVFPRQGGGLWITSWYETFLAGIDPVGGTSGGVGNAWATWNILNQNLSGSLYRLFTLVEVPSDNVWDVSVFHLDRGVLKVLTFAAQLGVVGLIWWGTLPRRSRDLSGARLVYRRLGEAGAVVSGMVLLSPMSSKSHFCVLLIPIAFCCWEFLYRRRSLAVAGALLVLLAGFLTTKGILGREVGNEVLARGSVALCALAALGATVRVLSRPPEESGPED